jgi:glycine cleavage system H protein
MSNPVELKYAKSHEWARDEGDLITVGISQHAQELLGDLVFVELPVVGKNFAAGAEVAVVESVKAASDVYSPVSGEIVEVNTALEAQPDLVNSAPYEGGWLFKIKPSDKAELNNLLSAEEYESLAHD